MWYLITFTLVLGWLTHAYYLKKRINELEVLWTKDVNGGKSAEAHQQWVQLMERQIGDNEKLLQRMVNGENVDFVDWSVDEQKAIVNTLKMSLEFGE